MDIGYLEGTAGDWRAAIQNYLQAIAIDPLMREAYTDLGYDYVDHHLYALGEAAYLKGLSMAPSDGRLHYLLGVADVDQRKRSLAITEFRRAAAAAEDDVAHAAARDLAKLTASSS